MSVLIKLLGPQKTMGCPKEAVEKLCKLSIREQLKLRKIKYVAVVRSLGRSGLLIPRKGGFDIKIAEKPSRSHLFIFGHELGHTSFFNTGLYPDVCPDPYDALPTDLCLLDPSNPLVQKWCDDFASAWIKRLTPQDKRFLEKRINRLVKEIEDGAEMVFTYFRSPLSVTKN